MPRLKVYIFQSFRSVRGAGLESYYGQTREMVATTSIDEVRRLTGITMADWRHSGQVDLHEADHPDSALALANPGVVFWMPLNDSYRTPSERRWRRAEPK